MYVRRIGYMNSRETPAKLIVRTYKKTSGKNETK